MRAHFMETMRLLKGEMRLLGVYLVLGLVFVAASRAVYLGIDQVFPPQFNQGYLIRLFLFVPISTVVLVLPGILLLHALGYKAMGHRVPFTHSFTVVVRRSPAWLVLALPLFALQAVLMYSFMLFHLRLDLPILRLISSHALAGLFDNLMVAWGFQFGFLLVLFPFLARLLLLTPAFCVINQSGLLASVRLGMANTTWRHVACLVPFALLALALYVFDYRLPFLLLPLNAEVVMGPEFFFSPLVHVYFGVQTLSRQFGIALLLVATIPIWQQVQQTAEVNAKPEEGMPDEVSHA
jgi:hypothetical protein